MRQSYDVYAVACRRGRERQARRSAPSPARRGKVGKGVFGREVTRPGVRGGRSPQGPSRLVEAVGELADRLVDQHVAF